MFKWIFLITFLIYSNCILHGQSVVILGSHQDTVKRLTDLIRSDQLLSTPAISMGGSPSKPFYRFIYLLSIINMDELVLMVSDTSRYLRIYGYIGLLHRKYPGLNKVKERLLRDSAYIETISGCNGGSMPIATSVKNIKLWYYRKAFDMLFEERVSREHIAGFPTKDLLID
jgi:hypothetical protein